MFLKFSVVLIKKICIAFHHNILPYYLHHIRCLYTPHEPQFRQTFFNGANLLLNVNILNHFEVWYLIHFFFFFWHLQGNWYFRFECFLINQGCWVSILAFDQEVNASSISRKGFWWWKLLITVNFMRLLWKCYTRKSHLKQFCRIGNAWAQCSNMIIILKDIYRSLKASYGLD